VSFSNFYATQEITLVRPRIVKDSSGGSKRVWGPAENEGPREASVQPVTAEDRASLGQRMIHATHKIYLRENPGFKRGDRVESNDGRIFLVYGSLDAAGLGRLWTLLVREKP